MKHDLDHVGVIVRDFQQAASAYERLGFNVTPLAYHVRQRADGSVFQSGTGNHCLVMRQGFVELLAVSDPAVHPGWVFDLLDKYEGLHLLGMGIFDLAASMAAFRRVDGSITMRHLFQTTQAGSSGPMASFNVVDVPCNCISELRVVAMEHQTRDIFFAENFLEHANGAQALAAATFCVDDPDRVAEELCAMFGCTNERVGQGERRLGLAPGAVELMTPDVLARRRPDLKTPAVPCGVGLTVTVDDLARTRHILRSRGIQVGGEQGERVLVHPADACGVALTFEATD